MGTRMFEPAGNGLECVFPLKGKGLTEWGESNIIYIEKENISISIFF